MTRKASPEIVAAVEERQKYPDSYVALYKGGAVSRLADFFTRKANNPPAIGSESFSDFTIESGGLYFGLSRELAEYHANNDHRCREGNRAVGVLTVYVPLREFKKDLTVLLLGDDWRQVRDLHLPPRRMTTDCCLVRRRQQIRLIRRIGDREHEGIRFGHPHPRADCWQYCQKGMFSISAMHIIIR